MPSTQPRSGIYAWDEQDARSIASNTPSYGGALFANYQMAEAAMPGRRSRPVLRLRLATRLKVLIRLRPRRARLSG